MPTAASRGSQAASTRHENATEAATARCASSSRCPATAAGGVRRSGEHLQRAPERRRPPELSGGLGPGTVLEQQPGANASRDPPGVHEAPARTRSTTSATSVRQALFAAAPDRARLRLSRGQDLGRLHVCSAQARFQSVSALEARALVRLGCERRGLLARPRGAAALPCARSRRGAPAPRARTHPGRRRRGRARRPPRRRRGRAFPGCAETARGSR